jgi:hypothetical protein
MGKNYVGNDQVGREVHQYRKNFELKFDSGNFFLFILPPIIFAAGFNLEKKNFHKS